MFCFRALFVALIIGFLDETFCLFAFVGTNRSASSINSTAGVPISFRNETNPFTNSPTNSSCSSDVSKSESFMTRDFSSLLA